MSTVILIDDRYRAPLLNLAAAEGKKELSEIVEEAIEAFLAWRASGEDPGQRALSLRGSFSDNEADSLRQATGLIRESWR